MEIPAGSDDVVVSDNLVVDCQLGEIISLQSANGNCEVQPFFDARFVVFMLQAVPE